jgi:hypothetical protein
MLGYDGLAASFSLIGGVPADTIFASITPRPIIAQLRNRRPNGGQSWNY